MVQLFLLTHRSAGQYLLKVKEEQDQREDGDSAISGLA